MNLPTLPWGEGLASSLSVAHSDQWHERARLHYKSQTASSVASEPGRHPAWTGSVYTYRICKAASLVERYLQESLRKLVNILWYVFMLRGWTLSSWTQSHRHGMTTWTISSKNFGHQSSHRLPCWQHFTFLSFLDFNQFYSTLWLFSSLPFMSVPSPNG